MRVRQPPRLARRRPFSQYRFSDEGGNDSLDQVGPGLGQRSRKVLCELLGGVGVRPVYAHGLRQSDVVERCSAEVDQGAVVQLVLALLLEELPLLAEDSV